MDARKNRMSLMVGAPGLLIQTSPFVGIVLLEGETESAAMAVWGMIGGWLLGTMLLIIGLFLYSEAKGHAGWWGLLGFIGLPGLLVLALLPDRTVVRAGVARTGHSGVGVARPWQVKTAFYLGLSAMFLSVFCPGVTLLMGGGAVWSGYVAKREKEAAAAQGMVIPGEGIRKAGVVMGYVAMVVNVLVGILILISFLFAE